MLKSYQQWEPLGQAGQTFVSNDVRQVDAYLDGETGLDDCQILFQDILIYGPTLRNWVLASTPHTQSCGTPEMPCVTLMQSLCVCQSLPWKAVAALKSTGSAENTEDKYLTLQSSFHPLSQVRLKAWSVLALQGAHTLHQNKNGVHLWPPALGEALGLHSQQEVQPHPCVTAGSPSSLLTWAHCGRFISPAEELS